MTCRGHRAAPSAAVTSVLQEAEPPRYFQAQLIGNVNYPWMPETHEMPAEAMSRAVVHQNLPEAGFGVPQIYQQVPMEDEADEVFLGDTTDDGFEGEETCEQGLDADGEHNE